MPVYFKKGNDTGEATTASIEPISNGEPLNQTTLRRPTDNLRVRTDELRRVVSELEINEDFLRGLTVRTVRSSPNYYLARGYDAINLDNTPVNPARVDLVDGTASIEAKIINGMLILAENNLFSDGAPIGSDAPFGYPYYVGYKFTPELESSLLMRSPGKLGGAAVLTRAAFTDYYNNYVTSAALGYIHELDGYLSSPGDCLALVVNRASTPPGHAEHVEDGAAIVNDLALPELSLGAEKTLDGLLDPQLTASAGTILKKFPEKTFFKLGALLQGDAPAALSFGGTDYTDLLTYLRARGDAWGFQIVNTDGSVNTAGGYRLLMCIKESWEDWGSHGGRGGAGPTENVADNSYNMDFLEVRHIHTAESFSRFTGSPVSGRGGMEIDSRQGFRLLHPESKSTGSGGTNVGKRWALFYVDEDAGTWSVEDRVLITAEPAGNFSPGDASPKRGFIHPRVNFPDHLVIPLVTFDGGGFSVIGNGGYIPLPETTFTLNTAAGDNYNKIVGLEGVAMQNEPTLVASDLAGPPLSSVTSAGVLSMRYFRLPFRRDPNGLEVQRLILRRDQAEPNRATEAYVGNLVNGYAHIHRITVDLLETFTPTAATTRVYIRVNNRLHRQGTHGDDTMLYDGGWATPNPNPTTTDTAVGEQKGYLLEALEVGPNAALGRYEFTPMGYLGFVDTGEVSDFAHYSSSSSGVTGTLPPSAPPQITLPVLEVFAVDASGTEHRYGEAVAAAAGIAVVSVEYYYGNP